MQWGIMKWNQDETIFSVLAPQKKKKKRLIRMWLIPTDEILFFALYWTVIKSFTFSEPTTSQWKALVRAFLKGDFILKGKGGAGGGGAMGGGGGALMADGLWYRGSGTAGEGARAAWAGEGRGEAGEGEGNDGTGGRTSEVLLGLRGLGTGFEGSVWPASSACNWSPPLEAGSAFSLSTGGLVSPPLGSGSVSESSDSSAMLMFRRPIVSMNTYSPMDFLFQSEHSLWMAWTQASRSVWTDSGAVVCSGRGTRNLQ